uniref:Small nuclear ribonucleoprotein 48 (U11/U12) n=1 Tax=Amphilophus citrinellus TaxID=61819 RepID=A0A3Q0QWZ2_AMPCI
MSDSLEPTTLQDRLERLQELTEFTEKCKKQINDIFEALGWSQDYKNSNREPMEQCPYDPDHMVPVRSMEKHKASCKLRKMGYSAEEQACLKLVIYFLSSFHFLHVDKSTQHQVILQARSACVNISGPSSGQYSGEPVDVPQNHKRAVCDLTVADRLALYDHVVGALNQQKEASSNNEDLYVDLVSKLQKDEEQNEPKTKLELMAEMRDYKRRRQSYRAKNVHITKKSYTEVIREVISVHSEELARQWREEQDEEESMRSEQRRADERRSTSSESRHSHSKRHRSRERSHERESKKKKSRKERDSRSPDDHHHHHHDKKKKKKKKKEEKEK